MIEALTLHPGGDPLEMARRVAAFLGEARESLDLALYDVRLPGEPGDLVAGALREAAERGVRVRIAYNDLRAALLPASAARKPELLEAMPFPTCGIPGIPDLMHHKYVVRDGRSVWTGSMNWTTDSWTLQENVVVTANESPELAAEYAQNFEELWSTRNVDASGREDPRPSRWTAAACAPGSRQATERAVAPDRQGDRVRAPAGADRVAGAQAGPVLGTLAEVAAERRVDLRGVVDRADGSGGLPVAHERLGVEDPDPRVGAHERGLQGQALNAVLARDARLHAREGDRGRRRGVRRLVQPVALG